MHVSPDRSRPRSRRPGSGTPSSTSSRGLHCTLAGALGDGHGDPSADALTKARAVADDYLAAYEEWLVKLAAGNATPGPQ
ncbi:hypothetical protein ABZ488_38030 [Streptomyces griseus]|uniref:hypothetical protein n=1 Tax=Streptomyces griseus TaxID=1911 RepID=UPI0033C49382